MLKHKQLDHSQLNDTIWTKLDNGFPYWRIFGQLFKDKGHYYISTREELNSELYYYENYHSK